MQVRQERTVPKLEQLHTWLLLMQRTLSAKSSLAGAIQYSLTRWQQLPPLLSGLEKSSLFLIRGPSPRWVPLERLANLKPSTQTISLRLPVGLLERIKVEANRREALSSLVDGFP